MLAKKRLVNARIWNHTIVLSNEKRFWLFFDGGDWFFHADCGSCADSIQWKYRLVCQEISGDFWLFVMCHVNPVEVYEIQVAYFWGARSDAKSNMDWLQNKIPAHFANYFRVDCFVCSGCKYILQDMDGGFFGSLVWLVLFCLFKCMKRQEWGLWL